MDIPACVDEGDAESAEYAQRARSAIAAAAPTVEHMVPRSVLHSLTKSADMHNFVLYHRVLNSKRSNYKYTSAVMSSGSNQIKYLSSRTGTHARPSSHDDFERMCAVSGRTFQPDASMRGHIARSVAYMMLMHPEISWDIERRVLDLGTMLLWHHMYPVKRWELWLNDNVSGVQGNVNPLVARPQSIETAAMALLSDAALKLGPGEGREGAAAYVSGKLDVFANFSYGAAA